MKKIARIENYGTKIKVTFSDGSSEFVSDNLKNAINLKKLYLHENKELLNIKYTLIKKIDENNKLEYKWATRDNKTRELYSPVCF